MNNSPVNVPTSDASVNSTAVSFLPVDILEMCVYSIGFLFGFPTHSYAIWLIITGAGSGIAFEFFMLNLSVCEIGICLNGLIFVVSRWIQTLSKFELFLMGFSLNGRPLFQCLICVERYLAVIHPVTFLKYKPLRYRLMCCSAAWIICLGSCLFSMFIIISHYTVFVWCLTVQFLVFLSIKLFCLSAVLRVLKQSGPGERRREREEENNMKRRAFHLILITSVSTVITYGPFIVTGIYKIATRDFVDIPAIWLSALICFTLAGFVQPVLYLHRTGKISCFCCPKNLKL